MTLPLAGRVVIVTGAASGIGRGILRVCLAQGARVAGLDIAADGAAKIEAEGGLPYLVDVADPTAFAAVVAQVRANEGRLDGMVNNAGLTLVMPFLEADVGEWDQLWQVNQRSVLVGAQAAARIMVADGTGGAIVNLASNHARASDVGYEAYAGTKGAITAMTRAMAWSLGKHGIRVNALCPGLTLTEAVAALAQDAATVGMFNSWHASGRVNSVDDVGKVAAYLLSDASTALTGAEIIADQGMTARLGALGF
jgi:3-oxoacyl-[acyl-carrier protein] reductase